MLISWKRKFVFIHIPKTGGTSLTLALSRYARPKDRLVYQGRATPILRWGLSAFFGGEKFIENVSGYHAHTRLSELENTVPRARLENFLKACFVRNPYTRTYSLYRHIRRNAGHPFHERFRDLDFHQSLDLMRKERWARQTEYLRFQGELTNAIDFIGYFERLEDDTARLFNAIGAPPPRSLARLNADPQPERDIREVFGDRLEDFVAYHAIDFETLGYSTNPDHARFAPERALVGKDLRD